MRIKRRDRFWVFMSAAFVLLQIADGVLTSIGMHQYGLELEANPIAALVFSKWGVVTGAIAAKAISFAVFFGFLLYCIYIRWSMLDIVGLLWKREPKRDRAYAMKHFNVLAIIVILASLYAGAGWTYLLIYLGGAS